MNTNQLCTCGQSYEDHVTGEISWINGCAFYQPSAGPLPTNSVSQQSFTSQKVAESAPFSITGPGFYVTRDGRKARVEIVTPGQSAALVEVGDEVYGVYLNGIYIDIGSFKSHPELDLVAPWAEQVMATQSLTNGACSNCGLTVDSISHQVYCEMEPPITLTSSAAKQGYVTTGVNTEHTTSDVVPCNCPMAPGFGGILHVAGCPNGVSK